MERGGKGVRGGFLNLELLRRNKMKKLIFLLVMAIFVSGCVTRANIKDIDVSKVESNCARECTKSYSQCISRGSFNVYSSTLFEACKESYQVCIETCPSK